MAKNKIWKFFEENPFRSMGHRREYQFLCSFQGFVYLKEATCLQRIVTLVSLLLNALLRIDVLITVQWQSTKVPDLRTL